jgi:hypothetical protein
MYNRNPDGSTIYLSAYRISTTREEDEKMKEVASQTTESDYDVTSIISTNCMDVCSAPLEAIGLDGGEYTTAFSSPTGMIARGSKIYSPVPNLRYQNIVRRNNGADVSDQVQPTPTEAQQRARQAFFKRLEEQTLKQLQAQRDATYRYYNPETGKE